MHLAERPTRETQAEKYSDTVLQGLLDPDCAMLTSCGEPQQPSLTNPKGFTDLQAFSGWVTPQSNVRTHSTMTRDRNLHFSGKFLHWNFEFSPVDFFLFLQVGSVHCSLVRENCSISEWRKSVLSGPKL